MDGISSRGIPFGEEYFGNFPRALYTGFQCVPLGPRVSLASHRIHDPLTHSLTARIPHEPRVVV